MAKLEAHKSTARLQHSIRLGQHPIDVRTIADAKCDRVRCERSIIERQLFSIGTNEIDGHYVLVGIRVSKTIGTDFAHVQHVLVDVADRDMRLHVHCLTIGWGGGGQVVDVVYVSERNVTWMCLNISSLKNSC